MKCNRLKKWLIIFCALLPAAGSMACDSAPPKAEPAFDPEVRAVYAARLAKVKAQKPVKLSLEDPIVPESYRPIASNESYELFLNEDNLSVYVQSKQSGAVIESCLSDRNNDRENNKTWEGYMKSGLVLSAIVGSNNTFQADLYNTVHKKDIELYEDGFSSYIYYPEYQFGLLLDVRLEGSSIRALVPSDSIFEEDPERFISTITLYPMMAYTHLDDEPGYMLIPDGNGALIYLDDKDKRYSRGFSQRVYGPDVGFDDPSSRARLGGLRMVEEPNKILAPFFGMVHEAQQTACLGLIEKGAERATIEAQPNGAMVAYNRIYARFLIRDIYVQPLNNSSSNTYVAVERERSKSDLQVRWLLTEGEKADYSGLAECCRRYLSDKALLEPRDTSYHTRVDFLGTDREESFLSTKAVVMTTAAEAEAIRRDLKEAGAEGLLSVYKGWQKGGLYNVPIKTLKAERLLGGNSELASLVKAYEEDGGRLYLYDDLLRLNTQTHNAVFNVIKRINRRTFAERSPNNIYDEFCYVTPERIRQNAEAFAASADRQKFPNLAAAGIGSELFSYHYSGRYYDRFSTAEDFGNIAALLDEHFRLVLEEPFAYLWNQTEAFLDMPTQSSDYMYTDEDVPFLSMVLKGFMPMYSDYANFEGDPVKFKLQLLEAGVFPSFYVTEKKSSALINTDSSELYSTEYQTHRGTIVDWDREFRAFDDKVRGAHIQKHERRGPLVTVTYDNGTVLYINYSDQTVTHEGLAIPALSYETGEYNAE